MSTNYIAGQYFSANISGTWCKGKVQVDKGRVYLCQNKMNGYECSDKLGYKYSFLISFKNYSVEDFGVRDLILYSEDLLDDTKILIVGDIIKFEDSEKYVAALIDDVYLLIDKEDKSKSMAITFKDLLKLNWIINS